MRFARGAPPAGAILLMLSPLTGSVASTPSRSNSWPDADQTTVRSAGSTPEVANHTDSRPSPGAHPVMSPAGGALNGNSGPTTSTMPSNRVICTEAGAAGGDDGTVVGGGPDT